MFVLFVDMNMKPGAEQALEKTYIETFRQAISRQEGFRGVELLRPNQAGGEWRLSIAFESRDLQKKWVAHGSASGSVAANGKPFCGLLRE